MFSRIHANMKILIAISYFQPDIGYAESKLAEQLTAQGHTVEVVTSNYYFPFPDFSSSVSSVLPSRSVKPGRKRLNGYWINRKKQLFEIFARSLFFGVSDDLTRFQPNIVLAFGVTAPITLQLAQLKKDYKYKLFAIDSHLPSELESGNRFVKHVFYYFFRQVFSNFLNKNLDRVIALQEATKGIIKNVYGISKSVQLIPHGSDLNEFNFDKKARTKIRLANNWNEQDFVIIYTGKVIPSKGIELLFKAFNSLLNGGYKVRLLIVGDGSREYTDECLSFLEVKYHQNVRWQGFIKQSLLYKYYSAADVAVWPLQESLAMNDAAACMLPFIANDQIGATLRVSNKNALLYTQGDSNDLATKIEYLYKHSSARKKMGQRGRELIEQKLSWQKLATRFIDG